MRDGQPKGRQRNNVFRPLWTSRWDGTKRCLLPHAGVWEVLHLLMQQGRGRAGYLCACGAGGAACGLAARCRWGGRLNLTRGESSSSSSPGPAAGTEACGAALSPPLAAASSWLPGAAAGSAAGGSWGPPVLPAGCLLRAPCPDRDERGARLPDASRMNVGLAVYVVSVALP
jgi:hypothetical protein